MTEKQLQALSVIRDALDKKGISHKSARDTDFFKAVKDAGIRAPWKLLDQHKTEDGNFDFAELFKKHLPNNLGGLFASEDDKQEALKEEDSQDATDSQSKQDSPKKSTKTSRKKEIDVGPQKLRLRDPVYVVHSIDSSNELHLVGVAKSWRVTWDKLRYQAIHDHGRMPEEEVRRQVESDGVCIFKSNASSSVLCSITYTELL